MFDVGPECTQTARGFGDLFRLRIRGQFERRMLYGISEERELGMFFDHMELKPGDLVDRMVLDAGCGVGRLTQNLGRFGGKVVGLDVHSALTLVGRMSRSLPNVQIIRGDIFRLPFRNESFDYVWCEGVLPYTHEPVTGFRRLSRVVKLGGRMHVLCFKERQHVYYRLRQLFPYGPTLPPALLLWLCRVLTVIYGLTQPSCAKASPPEFHATTAFKFYDVLSQPYRFCTDLEEVRSWFLAEGFKVIWESSHRAAMTGLKVG
jgi:ubiquinone/menaquinone biosynthesis C-methylase UbiE